MGRSAACIRRPPRGRDGRRRGCPPVRTRSPGALQGAEGGDLHRRAAQDRDGEDPEVRASREEGGHRTAVRSPEEYEGIRRNTKETDLKNEATEVMGLIRFRGHCS